MNSNQTSIQILTTQELIARLQKNGYQETFETKDNRVRIKGQHPFSAEIVKDKDGKWKTAVSVEMFTAYSFIPAFVFKLISLVVMDIDKSNLATLISCVLGYLVALLLLNNRKTKLETSLQQIISG